MVVVNLYPFVQTVSRAGVSLPEALENIDIGGPTMIRAAAKNFPAVLVVVDPADYEMVIASLGKGGLELKERRRWRRKPSSMSLYMIPPYLSTCARTRNSRREMTVALKNVTTSVTAKIRTRNPPFTLSKSVILQNQGITWAKQLWGKELSFNNILDASAAWATASDFADATVAIVKHTNTCGLASHPDLEEAYRRAFSGDPVSAFGGIVACNRRLTSACAANVANLLRDSHCPGYDSDAL